MWRASRLITLGDVRVEKDVLARFEIDPDAPRSAVFVELREHVGSGQERRWIDGIVGRGVAEPEAHSGEEERTTDRKCVEKGTSVSDRVELGGRGPNKKKN